MRDGDDNLELRGDQYVVRLMSARHDYENTQICQESLRENASARKRKETHGSAAVPNVTKGKRPRCSGYRDLVVTSWQS